jgi:hypothetical protein
MKTLIIVGVVSWCAGVVCGALMLWAVWYDDAKRKYLADRARSGADV